MSALETTLEWPRFCYTGPSLFEDTTMTITATKKTSRKRSKPVATSQKGVAKRLSSGSNTTESLSDGENSTKDEQMVPTSLQDPRKSPPSPASGPSQFAFSDLMRKMASKYQQNGNSAIVDSETPPTQTTTEAEERNCTTTSVASAAAGGFLTDAFSAALSHYLPFHAAAPAAGFLSHPFLSHFTHLTQPTAGLDSRVGSRALSALASSQKRPLENYQEQEQEQEQKIKRTRLYEYPLDLSPTSCGPMFDNDDVDILSIDPPSPSDVEQWSVDRVVDFVTNVESCRDYAQVFNDHSIDGSALLVLNESHLTRIMGLKLGPAIRLRGAIQELRSITNSSGSCNSD